jgi:O-antigen ligase
MRVFAVSVLSPGVEVEIADLRLFESGGPQVLANSDFALGQARWFPAAQSYFLPWHIDSLYLELLIERGLLGLLAFLAMIAAALWSLMAASTQAQPMAVFVAASLVGVLIVGLVSSVFDVPRVAFLFQFLVLAGLSYGQTTTRRDLSDRRDAQPH